MYTHCTKLYAFIDYASTERIRILYNSLNHLNCCTMYVLVFVLCVIRHEKALCSLSRGIILKYVMA